MVSTRQTSGGRRIGYYTVLWAVALIFFLPVLWIMMAAFKSNDDILSVPPKLAFSPTLDNVSRVLEESSTIPYFINSAWLALGSVVVAILVSLPAAYSF